MKNITKYILSSSSGWISLLYCAITATVLVLYPIVYLNETVALPGVLDNISFVILFTMLAGISGGLKKPLYKVTALASVLFFSILIMWGNLLYFRFFSVTLGYDIFKQYKDAAPLASAIWTLLRWPDIIFMFILPIFISIKAARGNTYTFNLKNIGATMILIIALTIIHATAFDSASGLKGANPMLDLPRQAMRVYMIEHYSESQFHQLSSDMDKYFPHDKELYNRSDNTTYPLLKEPVLAAPVKAKPNVVFILLESVRAFESAYYNHYTQGFTPNLDKLAREGIVARKFYANSSGTVNGEFASLASFYTSTGGETLYNKFPHLNIKTLPSILRDNGYSTAWISAYTADYGNKREFWRTHGVDSIYDSVPEPYTKLGWGPSDEDMFTNALGILNSMQAPFYAEILTLSNHFEFNWDYPTRSQTPPSIGDKLYQDYTSGVFYTDHALGQFMRKAKSYDFFDNTIFVIVGDHGVVLFPYSSSLNEIRIREIVSRVPLVIYAPSIMQHKEIKKPSSQVDIAPTVLDMLGIYDPNAFAGRSMLKDDQDSPSIVFTKYVSVWNMRLGNEYCYETGSISKSTVDEFKETRRELDPMNPERTTAAENIESLRMGLTQAADNYYCFSTKKDLLEPVASRHIKPIETNRRQELLDFGKSLNFMSSYMLIKDIIYPADAQASETTKPKGNN